MRIMNTSGMMVKARMPKEGKAIRRPWMFSSSRECRSSRKVGMCIPRSLRFWVQ